jgi:hypothetical protein
MVSPQLENSQSRAPYATAAFPEAQMCKNLFLRDKKKGNPKYSRYLFTGSLWLVVARSDTELDMKKLTKELKFKSGNLRFAHDDVLLETLGVKQGCRYYLVKILKICSCYTIWSLQ